MRFGRRGVRAMWRGRRGVLRAGSALAAVAAASWAGGALALPEGGTVVEGEAEIVTTAPGTMEIRQVSDRVIIEWQNFDVLDGESVSFIQPGDLAAALNRVLGGQVTSIVGSLSANGQIVITNPKGIAFGADAQVKVASIVASALGITNTNFLDGRMVFDQPGDPRASVTNQGTITAGEGGLAALVAPGVKNSGTIAARLGTVALAAGNAVTLDFYGDGLVQVAIHAPVAQVPVGLDGQPVTSLVDQQGAIYADGGTVVLTAAAAEGVLDRVINVAGLTQAQTIEAREGQIALVGAGAGEVSVAGTVDAAGAGAGERGGTVQVLGQRVTLASGASVDVSGEAGGGTVRIGGAAASAEALVAGTVLRSEVAYIAGGATVRADALGLGDGGTISAAGTGTLDFGGVFYARAGADGGSGGSIALTALDTLQYRGMADASGAQGGSVALAARSVVLSGSVAATGWQGQGGSIAVAGTDWVGLGAVLDAGGASGGSVGIEAGGLSLAGTVRATGAGGAGGTVTVDAAGKTWETADGLIDVSGASGGRIVHLADQQITTSATYRAVGTAGAGGSIDMSASVVKLLSPTIDASGATGGGTVRLGGEYQGGKALAVDELANADTLVATNGTRVLADATGAAGDGGTIVFWSDAQSVLLGAASAMPGTVAGAGGLIELSSAGTLQFGGTAAAGRAGRLGTVLLDPKFVDIGGASFSQLSLILGFNYGPVPALSVGLDGSDEFSSVSLDGTRLAVGAHSDDGAGNALGGSGAVHLFSFDDLAFANGQLVGTIGAGYIGGNNIDLSGTLDGGDAFGWSVSLDGTRLAVGAIWEDGAGNAFTERGAVHLFSFDDLAFTNGQLVGTIGAGYTVGNSIDLSATLEIFDLFGSSVSLQGTRLAVGVWGDDGFNSANFAFLNSGAVHLFTFADLAFNGGALAGTIGAGYAPTILLPDSINLSGTLRSGDDFGTSVSLDGTRLAVGARSDDGAGNAVGDSGAVHLFTFDDDLAFTNGQLVGTIGVDYAIGKDVDMTGVLEVLDFFGASVSLDGTQLAVGAPGDDGFNNALNASGAVYLFKFADMDFNGGALVGTVGVGYTPTILLPASINLSGTLGPDDNFGQSVSLDGTRLAAGARFDDGFGDALANAGAVHLFTFADTDFNGGALVGTIGKGYTPTALLPASIDLTRRLDSFDAFGSSVSLDGTRLAVGAVVDRGFGNAVPETPGAVHLFTFDDLAFGGARLAGTIGAGYIGGNNIDLTGVLTDGGNFGASVSLDGTRLAVGAPFARDALNARYGAVHLFDFADLAFANGQLTGTIGVGYTGAGSVDMTGVLDNGDRFGVSVSLDGTRLVVGRRSDDGFGNLFVDTGAVYLFRFDDLAFANGQHLGTIGAGYTGVGDVDLTGVLGGVDSFGASVSLDRTRLAVGAFGDDGFANVLDRSGAVYLFAFDDLALAGGRHIGSIGVGYTGAGDLDLTGVLGGVDFFGTSVSLDGMRLAVGAVGDDGAGNALDLSGAVYLFQAWRDGSVGVAFGDDPGGTVTLSAAALAALLAGPNNVVIQANTDITVSSAVLVANPLGDGGNLTLQAGRSILVNAAITTDNGDLTLSANDPDALAPFRDAGPAGIALGVGVTIDAGTMGSVFMTLHGGAVGTVGDILADATALVKASLLDLDSAGDIGAVGTPFTFQATGSQLDVSAAGDAVLHLAGALETTIAGLVGGSLTLTADPASVVVGTVGATVGLGVTTNTSITVAAGTGKLTVNEALASGGTTFIDADTVDLDADIAATGGLTGTASTVNVLSNAARIRDGVDVASAGATVNVGPGTYVENVVIAKDVDLVGDPGDPLVPGAGPDAPLLHDPLAGAGSAFVLQAGANDVSISGFRIEGFFNGIVANRGTTAVAGTSLTADNNELNNLAGVGLGSEGIETVVAAYNRLSGNISISVNHFAAATVQGNVLTNVIFGIRLFDDGDDPGTAFVRQNDIAGLLGVGVRIDGPIAAFIEQNFIAGNTFGIALHGLTDASLVAVFNNDLAGNTTAISNVVAGTVLAPGNWWGSADPAAIAAMNLGAVAVPTYRADGTDTDAPTAFLDLSLPANPALGFQGGALLPPAAPGSLPFDLGLLAFLRPQTDGGDGNTPGDAAFFSTDLDNPFFTNLLNGLYPIGTSTPGLDPAAGPDEANCVKRFLEDMNALNDGACQ